jgi:phosphatidylglycerophosphatase A
MKSTIAEAWATSFYAGFTPKAPGTAGALVGLLLAYLLSHFAYFSGWHLGGLGLALLLPSIWAANVLIAESGTKDPQIIVMDETIGQLLAFIGVGWGAIVPGTYVAAFALFRLFDMTKVFPVSAFERLPGGWGVMMDDVMAGLYAALGVWALREFGGLPV